jgi:murein L,D-transpeptidase YcbB/YkuD
MFAATSFSVVGCSQRSVPDLARVPVAALPSSSSVDTDNSSVDTDNSSVDTDNSVRHVRDRMVAERQSRRREADKVSTDESRTRIQVAAAPAVVRAPKGLELNTEPAVHSDVTTEVSSPRREGAISPAQPNPRLFEVLRNHPYTSLVSPLYEQLGETLLFHRNGVMTGTGRSVLSLLQDVARHGLDVGDYHVQSVTQTVSSDPLGEAQRDVALAYGVIRYVADFRFAQWADPLHTTKSWNALVDREAASIVAAAVALFPSVDVGLKQLWPQDPLYIEAMKALPEFESKLEGWRKQPVLGWRWKNFEPGDRHSLIGDYQRRLAFDGYYTGPITRTLDDATIEAVKAFQRDHGMVQDGRPGKTSNWRMGTTRKDRVDQLRATLFHLRESPSRRDEAQTYIRVNVAGADMQMYENGRLIREHKVVVGNNDIEGNRQRWHQGHLNRTPLMKTQLYEVVLNPVWIVPKRIHTGEFASKSTGYLQSKGIHSKGDVLVQSAGRHNVLGYVKFLLHNTNAVYMHDTNRRHLFDTDDRYRSHGCMRVSEAVQLAKYILKTRLNVGDAEFEAVLAEGKTKKFALPQPIDVYVEYVSTGLDETGRLVFHPDVYEYDRRFAKGRLPGYARVRWGSKALRPRNVPKIPFREYERLYAAGGLAPLKWPPQTSD